MVKLMEVVFSLALLTVVAVLLLNLYPTSALALASSRHRLAASTAATSELERQAARPFSQLALGTRPGPRGPAWTSQVAVTVPAGADGTRLRQVAVTVRWTEARGTLELTQAARVVNVTR
jgi:hypothetical protein